MSKGNSCVAVFVQLASHYHTLPSYSISGARMLSPPTPMPPPGATGGMAASVDVDPLDPLELLGLG